jgi:hypothetical protein
VSVGERHTLNGYSFVETLHGPFGPDVCVDCGARTHSVIPTGRIGAGGRVEDTGADVASRCSACGRRFHGVEVAGQAAEQAVKGVPFLVDQAKRRAHLAAVEAPSPPVLPSVPPDPYGETVMPLPAGAVTIARRARHCGFVVSTPYSYGRWLHKDGTVKGVAHTYAVRGHLSGRGFHVLYVCMLGTGRWTAESVLIVSGTPAGIFPYANITELKDWIGHGGDVPVAWFTVVRARVALAKTRAADTARARPKRERIV